MSTVPPSIPTTMILLPWYKVRLWRVRLANGVGMGEDPRLHGPTLSLCEAWGVSASQPGTKPAPPASEGEVLTIGQPGKSPLKRLFFNKIIYKFKELILILILTAESSLPFPFLLQKQAHKALSANSLVFTYKSLNNILYWQFLLLVLGIFDWPFTMKDEALAFSFSCLHNNLHLYNVIIL